MKFFKKIISAVLTLLIIISPVLPCYAAYENTYKNTGDNARDIIGVALTQIGYTEGKNDNTKYGEWYGLNYNPWCAMFVSWCANQAGIPKTVVPSHASCDIGLSWFKSHNKFENASYYGGDYVPVAGDIVYFGVPGDSTHVGIVYKVNDSVLTDIEGNSAGKVQTVNYKLNSPYILGYGTPDYEEISYGYTAGDYTTTAELLNVRAQPTTDSRIISQVEYGTLLTITDFYGNWGKTTVNGQNGWVFMTYCKKCNNEIRFDAAGGEDAPESVFKTEQVGIILPLEVPVRQGYSFLGWSGTNDALYPEYHAGDKFISDTVTTLYAIWQPDSVRTRVYTDENAYFTVTEKNGVTRIYIYTEKDYSVSYISLDGIQQILLGDSTDYLIEISDKSNHTVEVKTSENPVVWLNPFNDISESNWFYAPIGYCYSCGFFKGKSDLLFAPNDFTVRKNTVVVLGKVYEAVSGNIIADSNTCDFSDVEKNSYYEKYVQWASENGIAGGIGNGLFGIDSNVTRAQIVLMLKNLCQLLGMDVSVDKTAVNGVFDIEDAGDWATEGLCWAVTRGLMSVSTDKINPCGYATRAQIAQMLYNLFR
ncbi:MAG: S-layer homology domain-containing protein [Clostridia bacterium]|nr:S-layer homology domain-containing protein [Clostridia bacterium]